MLGPFVKSWLAGGVLLALAAVSHAQVYRSVGPDGKVTFTDKPPTAESAQARPPAVPLATPSMAPRGVIDANPVLRPAGQGRVAPVREAGGMEQGLRGVIGESDFVEAFRVTCGGDFPDERNRYGTAADQWESRNKEFIQRAFDVAGAQLGTDGRMRLRMKVLKDVHEAVDGIALASASKKSWCEDRFREIAPGGKSDQAVQAGSAALLAYQPKAK